MEVNRSCIDCNSEMLAEDFGYYHGFCPKCLGYENFNDYIMTERDFRIGSIVALVATGTEVEITSVNRLGLIEYIEFGDTDEYEDSITAFRPIPLTEEWLLKFRFPIYDEGKKTYSLYRDRKEQNLNECVLTLDGCAYISKICISSKVDYVHQLQNLYFALTGHELTLNNE